MVRYDLDSTLSDLINRYRREIKIDSYISNDTAFDTGDRAIIRLSNIQNRILETELAYIPARDMFVKQDKRTVRWGLCPDCLYVLEGQDQEFLLQQTSGIISCIRCYSNMAYMLGIDVSDKINEFDGEVEIYLNRVCKKALQIDL